MTNESAHFIERIIEEEKNAGKHGGEVVTRFPPEPNGYMHIGHAKAFGLDFGMAAQFDGYCNLRMDDTNPEREEQEYIDAIQKDIHWMGYDWKNLYYASDYYEELFRRAEKLINDGKAYVDDLSAEEIREYRGTLKEPGKNSPYRDRSIEENLDLFRRMRAGEFEDGSKVLRAKIDMGSGNINMRDPTMYRIKRAEHPRTGNDWCIYPMYDFAHPLSDAIEGVTHSLCSLEFEDHRPLYDWFVKECNMEHTPRQIEFARLNLDYMVMSKRKLRALVEEGHVAGWDDPRMPTLSGMRRRGYLPESLRTFLDKVGVSKANSSVDMGLLEFCVREDLNAKARRVMAVIDPIKLTITNWPEGSVEMVAADNNPEDENAGTREVPFTGELWIEREDFREDAPKKWFRFAPGKEVRLKHAYYVTCTEVIKDSNGEVVELKGTYDPASKGGWSDDGRKVRGTVHWVSRIHALDAEVREYGHLFTAPVPGSETGNFLDDVDPESLVVRTGCKVEPSLGDAKSGESYQFLRKGYYCRDEVPEGSGDLVFNKTVGLRDSWAKLEKKLES